MVERSVTTLQCLSDSRGCAGDQLVLFIISDFSYFVSVAVLYITLYTVYIQ